MGKRGEVNRRATFCLVLAAMAAVGAAAGGSTAFASDDWPNRPVRIMVPYGAGGLADVQARFATDRLARIFGQPFVIENRATAGGSIGLEQVFRAPADGYTFFFAGTSLYFTLPASHKLSFDLDKDFTPVSEVGVNPMAIVVDPKLPVRSLPEFLAYVRDNPGKLNYSTIGGGSTQLASAAYVAREKLDMVGIGFGSGPAAITAVMSGNAQMHFGNTSDVLEHARTGAVRMLAVSSEKRLAAIPEIPTVAETTPGFSIAVWNGFFARTGTPQPIIDRFAKAVMAICREDEIVKKLDALGIEAVGASQQEMAAMLERDRPIFTAAVEAAGLRKN